jgi:hypothetical protein
MAREGIRSYYYSLSLSSITENQFTEIEMQLFFGNRGNTYTHIE